MLRKLLFLLAAIGSAIPALSQAAPAALQPGPRYEIAGGYSVFRGDFGTDHKTPGWNAGFAVRLNPYLGFEGKLFGAYGKADDGRHTNMHGLLIGPRVSLPIYRLTLSASGGLGLARWQRAGFGPLGPVPPGHPISIAKWIGGGADFRLTRRLSLRLMEVDYVKTTFLSGDNGLFSTGVVYRFGRL